MSRPLFRHERQPTGPALRSRWPFILVCFLAVPVFAASVAAQQPQFRAPKLPSDATSRRSANDLDSVDSRRNGIGDSNHRTPSPHLTRSHTVDLGVQQRGTRPLFQLPAGHRKFIGTLASAQKKSDLRSTGETVIQFPDLESIEGVESELPIRFDTDQSEHDQQRSSGTRRPVGNRTVITERYPDGKPKIEREVAQDAEGNFFNDGFWRVKGRSGKVIAQGQYRGGVMHGQWQRQHTAETSGLFSTKPFSLFQSPFLSAATFNHGKLDGMWTVVDSYERKIFEIPYRQNVRHGTATWWYPSLNKMREATFKKGLLDGELLEWDEQNKLTREEKYQVGKKLIRNITFYRPQQKKSENFFLGAKLESDGSDDWWGAEPAPLKTSGERLQHGPTAAWHENGLPKMKGEYDNGTRVGRFTWWHSNGNKQLQGAYQEGQKSGRWTWWHENGMKAIEGHYEHNRPSGRWRWWDADGQLDSEDDLSGDAADATTDAPGRANNPETLPEGNAPRSTDGPDASDSDPEDRFDLNDLEDLAPHSDDPENDPSVEDFFSD